VGARLSRRVGPREGKTSWATREGLAGPKARKTRGGKGNALQIPKEFKQMNSNTGLNSTNQKLCSSMNATINSYGSFI
jgi:hypothetical protein